MYCSRDVDFLLGFMWLQNPPSLLAILTLCMITPLCKALQHHISLQRMMSYWYAYMMAPFYDVVNLCQDCCLTWACTSHGCFVLDVNLFSPVLDISGWWYNTKIGCDLPKIWAKILPDDIHRGWGNSMLIHTIISLYVQMMIINGFGAVIWLTWVTLIQIFGFGDKNWLWFAQDLSQNPTRWHP
jgi:hypothetical protein